MKLKRRALEPKSQRHLFHSPPLVHPIRHNLHDTKGHRDRGALKVLALARSILWHHGDRNIEPSQTREAAQHKEAQQDVVDGCAETEAKSSSRRRHTEGDELSKRIEFLAHKRRLLAPARDFAVHEVEEEAEGDEA